jgi:hypothetical protein
LTPGLGSKDESWTNNTEQGGNQMTRPSFIIAISLLVAAFAVGVWDIWVAFSGHQNQTVSSVLRGWAKEFPFLPFFLGYLAGHIFG